MNNWNIGIEGKDYIIKATFNTESEAETYMLNNVLENGFYRSHNSKYIVYEWIV